MRKFLKYLGRSMFILLAICVLVLIVYCMLNGYTKQFSLASIIWCIVYLIINIFASIKYIKQKEKFSAFQFILISVIILFALISQVVARI